MKTYLNKTVLTAARERIALLFDNFETITVSVSSGKDSTVLFHLCVEEAMRRNRKIRAFFLDQEAEYENTITIIREIMQHDAVVPFWYQVPLYMTNATSYSDYFLYAWGPGEQWIREKDPLAIHAINEEYPRRFYGFFSWWEKKDTSSAYLIGLRADEGITRYRALTKHPGWNGLKWATRNGDVNKFYPIYDWGVKDIWRYIYDFRLRYNKIYDLMFQYNYSFYKKMRISNLIHEKAFRCLADLPRFEPETYDKLCRRISGIATASRYATERMVFTNKQLPRHYGTWKEFRDFLLENVPSEEHKQRFVERFSKQPETERAYKAQVGQLLINDYENSRSFDTKQEERIKRMKEKWMKLL